MAIDKEEFERAYCEKSGITREYYNDNFVTLPCECDYEGCEGWACVDDDPLAIAHYTRNWEEISRIVNQRKNVREVITDDPST